MRSPGDRWGTRHRRNRTRYKYGNSSHHMLPIVPQRCRTPAMSRSVQTHACLVHKFARRLQHDVRWRWSLYACTPCAAHSHAQRRVATSISTTGKESQVQHNLSVPVLRRAPRCIRTCSHPIVTCTWVQWHVGIGAQLDAQHLAHGYVCFGSVLAPSAHAVDHTTTAGCIRANGTQHHSPSPVPSIFAPDTASGRTGASTYR